MSILLQRWLDSDVPPVDVYELLDQPRLCPAGSLMDSIRMANRELIDFQNHPDPAVVHRARRLQMLLGQTEYLLNDDTLIAQFEAEFWERMQQEYAANRESPEAWQPFSIRQWLQLIHNVSPNRLDEGVQRILRHAPVRPSIKQSTARTGRRHDLFEALPPEPNPNEPEPQLLSTVLQTQSGFDAPAKDPHELPKDERPPAPVATSPVATIPVAPARSAVRSLPPALHPRPTTREESNGPHSTKPLPWLWIALAIGVAGMVIVLTASVVVLWVLLK